VRDPEALAHAEGALTDALARGRVIEADQVQQTGDAVWSDTHLLRRDRERLAPAPAGVLCAGVEQNADAPAGVRQLAIRTAEDECFAGVGAREAGQNPEGRRLAGAVGAEEPPHGPRLDAERDVVDDRSTTEPLGEAVCLDHGASVAASDAVG
jgi:hypothetical protein